jgi:hypothetical protein
MYDTFLSIGWQDLMSLLAVEVGGLHCRHATRCPSYASYTSQCVAARLVHKNELERLVFRQLI